MKDNAISKKYKLKLRNADDAALERVLGDKRAARFGPAFLDVLQEAG